MSASAQAQVAPATIPRLRSSDLWDDPSVELNENRLRKHVPKLPVIASSVQTVKASSMVGLAYLMIQVQKSEDKDVLMRAIASATSIILHDNSNFTGSSLAPVELELPALDETSAPDLIISTNFADAEEVTVAELTAAMAADEDEIGAYFGVMYLAGCKKITTENRSAFNEKRASSATASIIGAAKIFVPDSPYLADDVLARVYAAFLSRAPYRAHMVHKTLAHLDKTLMGPAQAFMSMFLLLVDNGMSAMRIIKEGVLKHPWIRTDFPELIPELAAANEAQKIIRQAPGRERSFLKAIHGNNFVPVNYAQIDNLTGVCKEVLKRSTPSYQNYSGGRITESQLERVNAKMTSASALVTPVPAE
jgi:hypothetical protein